jgi:hypothetical protein
VGDMPSDKMPCSEMPQVRAAGRTHDISIDRTTDAERYRIEALKFLHFTEGAVPTNKFSKT